MTLRSATPIAADTGARYSETATRILTVAEDLFAEHGFGAVSINAIADRAGVSKANVFHHFVSKRELYLTILHRACDRCTEHIPNLEAHNGAFEHRFAAYSVDLLNDMLAKESLHRLMLRELLGEDDGRVAKELAERVFGANFARL